MSTLPCTHFPLRALAVSIPSPWRSSGARGGMDKTLITPLICFGRNKGRAGRGKPPHHDHHHHDHALLLHICLVLPRTVCRKKVYPLADYSAHPLCAKVVVIAISPERRCTTQTQIERGREREEEDTRAVYATRSDVVFWFDRWTEPARTPSPPPPKTHPHIPLSYIKMAAISSPCSLKVALPARISSSRKTALRTAVVSRQAAPKVAVVSKEQLALAAPVVAAALTAAPDANAAEVGGGVGERSLLVVVGGGGVIFCIWAWMCADCRRDRQQPSSPSPRNGVWNLFPSHVSHHPLHQEYVLRKPFS